MRIPDNINRLGIPAAARIYRDLGLAPHPLSPPDSTGASPGKRPLLQDWPSLTPADTDDAFLDRHFGKGSKANLGLVPQGDILIIDLDAKPSGGEAAKQWLSETSEANGWPRVLTGSGYHLYVRVADLPSSHSKRTRITKPEFSPGVGVEFYIRGCNVAEAPSVHESGHRYRWERTGEIPVVPWSDLTDIFAIEAGTSTGPTAWEDIPDANPFGPFKGDIKTLDIVGMFDALCLLGTPLHAGKGFNVECLWQHEHTQTSGERTGTAILTGDGDVYPVYKCHHSSCEKRSLSDALKLIETDEAGVVDSWCGSRFGGGEMHADAPQQGGDTPAPAPEGPQPVEAFDELACPPASDREVEIVKGIIPERSKLILSSSSKSRKTWIMMDLAIAIATGGTWFGRECAQRRVLYLNLELHPHTFRHRLRKILRRRGIPPEALRDQLTNWHLRGHTANADRIIQAVENVVTGRDYGYIILDPLYKLLGGRNENAAGEMNELMDDLERIISATASSRAGIATSHHFSKGNKSETDALDRSSGSGVLVRDPDVIMSATPHEDPNCHTIDVEIRSLAPVDPWVVRWDDGVYEAAPELDPSALRKAGRKKNPTTPEELASLLVPGEPLTHGEFRARAIDAFGFSPSLFSDLRARAMVAGLIIQPVPRGPYTLP